MEFVELLRAVADEPVFETGLLLAGEVDPLDVRKQLSRWTAAGKIWQLRRGLYCLAPPYQKEKAHPFLVANRLVGASYVSLQSALGYYGMIPEYVPQTTSVTTHPPTEYCTPLGDFAFRHIQVSWLKGYRQVKVGAGQQALIATPEKALLDLVYLTPDSDSVDYLESLRLQALDQLNVEQLFNLAREANKPKLLRAAERIRQIMIAEAEEYEDL